MTPRRIALRAATSDAHAALDRAMGRIETPGDYARYLRVMIPFRAALESHAALDLPEGFAPTRIHELLNRDAADLDVAPPPVAKSEQTLTADEAIGVAYVLEGSGLGAALTYRAAQALGYHDKFGARHLARQVGARDNWRAFLTVLEDRPALDVDKAAAAAIAAFALAQTVARDLDASTG